jgi:hypothetical protein
MRGQASFAGLLFLLALPAVAQDGAGKDKDFVLAVCNGGKIPVDAFAAVNTPPAVVNIAPDACQDVYTGGKNEPAYVGFAFPDAKGQWGAPRRYDFTPSMAKGVLTRANQSVSVRRGNQTVTTAAQFAFRAEDRVCQSTGGTSPSPNQDALPLSATAGQRAAAAAADNNLPKSGGTTICTHYYYEMIVAAYADTHELQFLSDCERCPTKAPTPQEADALVAAGDFINMATTRAGRQGASPARIGELVDRVNKDMSDTTPRRRPDFTPHLQNWPDFFVALAAAGASSGMPPGVPRVITVRGTVSKIVEAAPNASEHWIDIFFKEAPDGRFDACTLGPEILSEVYGPNFRTALIGQVIEVEGDIQRYYCKGFKGSVRVSLAHQARRSDVTQLAAVMIPRAPAAPAKVENPYQDPAMPNYYLDADNIATQLQQYCSAIFDPAELTPKQQEIRKQYASKVAFEVSYCKNQFDASEVQKHRRLAMEYCVGQYDFPTGRGTADAYDFCMMQNDELVKLCSLRPNSHKVITVADARCNVRPNPQETQAILKKLKDTPGGPGGSPGLTPFLLTMTPGTIEVFAPTPAAVSPQPAGRATPPQPAVPQPTNPGPAPAAPQAPPRLTPEAVRQRQQELNACRQQAVRDFPRGGPGLASAMADCNKILQQR